MDPIEQLTIDTPEQVGLEFPLSGIGSRILAFFVDSLVQFIAFLALFILLALISTDLGRFWPSAWNWTAAFYILVAFCLYWGYFAVFETLWSGQTPGKRYVGIRVIGETGRSVSVYEAIARNLMRAVDSLPGMYAVACIAMFIDRKNRRLGDLVAHTVVVHDKKEELAQPTWGTAHATAASDDAVARNITLDELNVIEAFLTRRLDLAPEVRQATAQHIADHFAQKLNVAAEARGPNEDFLEGLAHQARNSASFR